MKEQKPEKCPACAEKRMHNIREWKDHHPLAGHGITDGSPSLPDLIQAPEPFTSVRAVKPLFTAREA